MEIELEVIKQIVSDRFKINISKRSRKTPYIKARAIYSQLAYKHSNKSLDCIGKTLGNRTHATILHAIKTFKTFNDVKFLEDYKYCKRVIYTLLNEEKLLLIDENAEEEIKQLKEKVQSLQAELIKNNILLERGQSKYKEINDVLKLDDESIRFFCETRLKPFLKMQESKVTNKDLIQKQILTRTM